MPLVFQKAHMKSGYQSENERYGRCGPVVIPCKTVSLRKLSKKLHPYGAGQHIHKKHLSELFHALIPMKPNHRK